MKTFILSVFMALALAAADAPKPKESPITDTLRLRLWKATSQFLETQIQLNDLRKTGETQRQTVLSIIEEAKKSCSGIGWIFQQDQDGDISCGPPPLAPSK